MIFSRLYTLSLTVLVVIAAVLFHLNPDSFLADDAYFYPQIADQVVKGHGSTFHQYSFTNGYQPLWMLFCIVAAGIAGGDKMALLHILGVFQVGFFLITIYYLFQVTVEGRLRFFSVGLAFLTVLMLTVGGLRLFESHLAITLQMASFYLFLRLWEAPPTTNALAAASVLMGMVFLARTDAFFFSAAYAIALALRVLGEEKPLPERCFRVMAVAMPAVLIALFYMSFNKVAFGHPVPISGVIKSSFPHPHVDWNALGLQGQYIVGATLLLTAAAVPLAAGHGGLQALLGVCFIAVFLHAAYIICFSWGNQWHYTTAFAAFPVALQLLLTAAAQRASRPRLIRGAICLSTVCVLAAMVAVGYMKTYSTFSVSLFLLGKQSPMPMVEKSPRMQLVDIINAHIEPGAGMAVFDSPGVLAYFTHARILPLDGLVNDRNYDEVVAHEGAAEYFRRQNIHYLLAAHLPDGEEYRSSTLYAVRHGDAQYGKVFAPIQKVEAGDFILADDALLFEGPNPIPGAHNFSSVGIWRL